MFIQKEILVKINPVAKATAEKRLRFYSNGSYSYLPSREYIEKYRTTKFKETETFVLKGAARRLKRIVEVMDKGKRVTRVQNGIIC